MSLPASQQDSESFDIREMAAGVWAVGLGDGSHVVAKHQAFAAATAGRPDDLLIVEPQVLGLLAESGCPVPRAWSVDAETGFIFLEFCGAHTIDDIAQESGVSRDLSARLVTGFCQIERVLSQRQNELLPLVSSAATRQLLHEAATRTHAETREGLATILIHCQPLGVGSGGLETHLDDICRRLSQRSRPWPVPISTPQRRRRCQGSSHLHRIRQDRLGLAGASPGTVRDEPWSRPKAGRIPQRSRSAIDRAV